MLSSKLLQSEIVIRKVKATTGPRRVGPNVFYHTEIVFGWQKKWLEL